MTRSWVGSNVAEGMRRKVKKKNMEICVQSSAQKVNHAARSNVNVNVNDQFKKGSHGQ